MYKLTYHSISDEDKNRSPTDFRNLAKRAFGGDYVEALPGELTRYKYKSVSTNTMMNLSAQLAMEKARIKDNNGLACFVGLYDLQGNRIPARLETKMFGYFRTYHWRIDPSSSYILNLGGRERVPANGVNTPKKIQKALGLIERAEMAPAWARVEVLNKSSGIAWIDVYRAGDEYGSDAILIP